MATLFVQGGSSLYKVDMSTGTATALTLPSGITLSTTRKPRWAVLNQWVVLVNSPTRNLAIDPEGTVRVLVPRPPTHPPTIAAGSSTGLTGDFMMAATFVVLNSDGELLMESPMSPLTPLLELANQDISATDVPLALDTITARRIYRTAAGGTALFHLLDLDGNEKQAFINAASDDTLALLPAAADTLVAPPGTLPGIRFKTIIEWKSRLWGVADSPDLVDTIFATETNKIYAWSNRIVAHPTGLDAKGVIGFIPRKNQLGVLKRNGLWQIAASSSGAGISISNASVQQVVLGSCGGVAEDSIVVRGDVAWYLGADGIYEWGADGIPVNVSDAKVKPWFTTDTYFNRSRFPNAFGKWNEVRKMYELHLAAAGSSTEDRWISFDPATRAFYGPHKSALVTPSHAAHGLDANGLPIVFVGGTDGIIYTGNSANYRDGASTAIDWDCIGPFHHAGDPDSEHYWGELSVLSQIEGSGVLTITPTVGRLNASAGTAISHTLTTGRERLRRLGNGALCRLRFQQATVNVGCSLFGYEINPVHRVGRR